MPRPFTIRTLNKKLHRPDVPKLPDDMIMYADTVIHGLHAALRFQTTPPYRRPEHAVDGWGLTATPVIEYGEFHGIPTVRILGRRSIFLAAESDTIHRVLSIPHPDQPFEQLVIQIKHTNVPALLDEDPTLYLGLLTSVDESIQTFDLDYAIPTAPIPTQHT
jgi:hypothetical protein